MENDFETSIEVNLPFTNVFTRVMWMAPQCDSFINGVQRSPAETVLE